jgi:hypothetical protein
MFKRLFGLLLGLSCTASLFGASPVYEGFDYVPSPLAGQNGGSGFAAPWLADPNVLVQPPGLSAASALPSTGLAIGGGFNSARPLFNALNAPDYWASFQIQAAPGNDQVFLGLDTAPSSLPLVSFGRILNTYFIRQGGGPIAQGGVGSAVGITDLLVAHFQQTGPGTLVQLWVNPTDYTLPPTVSTLLPFVVSYTYVDMQVQPGFLADEVRIGMTPLEVSAIPEPGSLGLLALGLWALLWRRAAGPPHLPIVRMK